ncbi:MAG: hypothetical protein ACK55I_34795, partial [bacterium]
HGRVGCGRARCERRCEERHDRVSAAAIGVVRGVEVPVVRPAVVVLLERRRGAPDAWIPAKRRERRIRCDRIEVAGVGLEAEVRAEMRAREFARKAFGLEHR